MRLLRVLLPCFCAALSAAETYRWVDKEGVVHFSDSKPETIEQAERIKLKEQPRLSGTDGKNSDALERIERTNLGMSLDRQARADERRLLAQEKAKQEKACEDARRSLKILSGHYVPYNVNDAGEKTPLTADEIKGQRAQVEEYLASHC